MTLTEVQREAQRKYNQTYREKNREEYNAVQLIYTKKWQETHKEQISEKKKEYYQKKKLLKNNLDSLEII
jgi:gluconate kinase